MEQETDLTRNQKDDAVTAVPDLSIVMVCWNNLDYLVPCLESLYGSEMHSSFEVMVVDNGSTDGTLEMLRADYPQVRIIANDQNVGLAKANNQGTEATNGRYVLLLNNDTIVNGPSFDAMVEFLDSNPTTAAVGGSLLNPDGSVQSCYNDFPTLHEDFLIASRLGEFLWEGYPGKLKTDQIRSVGWVSSACIMLRRDALDEVGLLDEDYFIYGDEADLQYRLKQAGWDIYYIPQAHTIHYGGRSMNRWGRRKMAYRGHMLFYRKNYGEVRTTALRTMLGGLSLSKILVWSAAGLLPQKRERARRELQSNIDVVKLCYKLE